MKPLRPFPLPLNIGTDICRISRIYAILAGPRRARFLGRVLAPEEHHASRNRLQAGQTHATGTVTAAGHEGLERGDPEGWKTAAFVAGRFAAKEAAIKAHSHRRLTFHDVIIERRAQDGAERLGSGPPVARIRSGGDAEADDSAMVSISHDGDYATAVCLAHDPSVVGGREKTG